MGASPASDRRPQRIETTGGPVSALWDGPARAEVLVVLAPGAGAGIHTDFMRHFAERLAAHGAAVCRFNFLYSERGRKTPDRQPVLEATYGEVVEAALDLHGPTRLVLGGKSMGGRIASHIVAGGVEADGLVFLGYPLHPPGRPERLRDAHLRDISAPMLFVQGTRDTFAQGDLLAKTVRSLPLAALVTIEDGNHSLAVRGRSASDVA